MSDRHASASSARRSVESILREIAARYLGRVVVRESAFRSAKDSRNFRELDRAWKLLTRLATEYRDALIRGGDAVARKVFGANVYAAHESKTTRNNKRAKQARMDLHDGQQTPMEQHLKIGHKDSPATTLRIHFYWDSELQVVVIGHCGPHLPLR